MVNKEKEIEKIKQNFNELILTVFSTHEETRRIDKIERHILKVLLSIGMQMIKQYVNLVNTKTEAELKESIPLGYQSKGFARRSYFSIFGSLSFTRKKLYNKETGQSIYPTDIAMGMPKGKYSYNLQDWIGYSATDTDFRSSVELLNKIFCYSIKEMQSERISNELSEEVEVFYEEKTVSPENEGHYFAAGFDDKGVPILPIDAGREVDSNGVRLGKGQKNGVKKSSTVSVTYSFEPNIRTAEDVIASLFKENKYDETKIDESLEPKQQAQNKHIRAFLSDKKKAMEYGFENILKRSQDKERNIVVLVDGDRGLEKAIDKTVDAKGIKNRIIFKVLDFIHVVEYLWKAANIYYGEKSPLRTIWVKEQSLLLLQGKINIVLINLQSLIQHGKYKTSKHKIINSVIKYLSNHKHMMNYKECLAKGFPISTGAIESACGHFVQCRMERNGMRWSIKGAKNMLNLRAVNKNKDWDEYMQYYIEKKNRNYERAYFKMSA